MRNETSNKSVESLHSRIMPPEIVWFFSTRLRQTSRKEAVSFANKQLLPFVGARVKVTGKKEKGENHRLRLCINMSVDVVICAAGVDSQDYGANM